jgi:hypothetical protein
VSFKIFPATDLHLLRGASVSLRFFAHVNNGVWTDISALNGFSIQFNPAPAFITQAGLTLTATGPGRSVTRVSIPLAGASAPMRLAVHQQLQKLFLPQAALALEANRADRVLTVYGEFKAADGSIVTADITAHPYLRYRVTVKSGSPTIAVSPAGRVSSGAAVGEAEIEVSVDPALTQPAPAVKLNLKVVAAPTDRPILTRFHTGTAARKKSILFLPDGFTGAQQAEFETLAGNVGRKLLQAISPYRHLRESFDLYSAFAASTEEGVTIGPPILPQPGAAGVGFSLPTDQPIQNNVIPLQIVLSALGDPGSSAVTTLAAARTQLSQKLNIAVTAQMFPQNLFDLWQSLKTQSPQSRVRETFFGTMIGERHHGTEAFVEPPSPPSVTTTILLERGVIRDVFFDERRLPDLTANDPKKAHLPALGSFLSALRVAGEAAGQGAMWAPATGGNPAGASFGLVVFIARADHYGGVRQEGCLLLSLGPGMIHNTAPSTVVPRLLEVVPVPRPISAADRKRGFGERPIDALMDVVAHELAHSPAFGALSDEYGGKPLPNPLTAEATTFAEDGPNSELIANALAGAGPGLNATQLKWNLERVDGAARVDAIRAVGTGIEIDINTDDARRWPALAAGRLLTLRAANLAAPAPGATRVGSTPANPAPQSLNLTSYDATARTIRCSVLGGNAAAQVVNTFPAGSVILVPRLSAGATVRIIPNALVTRLTASGQFSPSNASCVPAATPAPPNIPGFVWPRHQLQAVAAYEVGAGFDCGVIRPTGECKMRTVIQTTEPPTEFCFVCKYAMANAIDPASLVAIDKEYP